MNTHTQTCATIQSASCNACFQAVEPSQVDQSPWIVNSKQDGASCVWRGGGSRQKRMSPCRACWPSCHRRNFRLERPQDAGWKATVCLSMCVLSPHTPTHSPQPLASFLPFVKSARQTLSSWAHKRNEYECVLSSLLGPPAPTPITFNTAL